MCSHIDNGIWRGERGCFWKVSWNQHLCDPPDGHYTDAETKQCPCLSISRIYGWESSISSISAWQKYLTIRKELFHFSICVTGLKNEKSSLDVWKKKKRDLTQGPFGSWRVSSSHCLGGAVPPPLPISLCGTLQGRAQLYAVRSAPVTLDGVAILSINHQLNQKWEETTPLTTLSQHLFTSHWFGKSHRSTASRPHAPTLRCWVYYYVKLCSDPRQGSTDSLRFHSHIEFYKFLNWI